MLSQTGNAHDNPNARDSNAHDSPTKDRAGGSVGDRNKPDGTHSREAFTTLVYRVNVNHLRESSPKPLPQSDPPREFLSRNADHLSVSREFAREVTSSYDRIAATAPLGGMSDQRLAAIWESFASASANTLPGANLLDPSRVPAHLPVNISIPCSIRSTG